MTLDNRPQSAEPLRGVEDCIAFFRSKEKPRSRRLVGLEYETIPVVAGALDPVPFEGPGGVAALLRGFERFGYEAALEAGRPVAALKDGAAVTVEPGCQLELSGRPWASLRDLAAELDGYLRACRELGSALGHELLGVGYRPFGGLPDVDWSPKLRYAPMRPFLAARGGAGDAAIAMTASVQVSLDFGGERELGEMLRTLLAVQPVVAALYANSPFAEGEDTGWKSHRLRGWLDVDPARCGLLPFAFEPDFVAEAYRRYAEWALDVPIMFLRRGGGYVDAGGAPFRACLARGFRGEPLTVSDWEDHLTTIFTEARVKGVVEARAADSCDAAMTAALPALLAGLLYDEGAREEAFSLVKDFSPQERREHMRAAAQLGLGARAADGRPFVEIARGLVDAAARGLRALGEGGAPWLDPLAERPESGRCPADDALSAFRGGGEGALARHLRVA